MSSKLRVGVAGPVGSGKTALVETLCLSMKKNYEISILEILIGCFTGT